MVIQAEAPKPNGKKLRCTPLAPRPHPHVSNLPIAVPVPATPPPIMKPGVAAAGASASASDNAAPPPAPDALKKRQFSKADEETLVRLWKENIEQYYKGVRRRVLEKMTAHMNSTISAPPYFALKQVENKLSYMEKRYRSVLEEMRRLGFTCGDNDPSSVRISCERKFCLFYDVHDILRDVVGNDAYSKRSWDTSQTPPTKIGSGSASASAATTPASSATPLPRVPEASAGLPPSTPPLLRPPPPPPDLDDAPEPVLQPLPPLPLLDADDAEAEPAALKRKARPPSAHADTAQAVDGVAPVAPAVGTPQGKRRRSNVEQPVASRIAQIAQSFLAMSEGLLTADEQQRRDAMDISRRELDIRRRELDLKHKEADVRLAESRNSQLAERIAGLRFLATSLGAAGDHEGQARVLKKMEDLIGC